MWSGRDSAKINRSNGTKASLKAAHGGAGAADNHDRFTGVGTIQHMQFLRVGERRVASVSLDLESRELAQSFRGGGEQLATNRIAEFTWGLLGMLMKDLGKVR